MRSQLYASEYRMLQMGDVANIYPDGTVRDPSIVFALLGFYRKRSEGLMNRKNRMEESSWKL